MKQTAANPVNFLLVDDLDENLLALEGVLRREGLELLKAKSGREALELLLRHEVALAFVDVQMSGMDGFELAELMRGTERTRLVPIIFLTAGSDDWQRRFRGYEAGAVDFLTKPIEPHILRSKAEVFFELWRERENVKRQRDELRLATEENVRLLHESRKIADELREADRKKDEFLATLSHELRNPLAPIGNGLQLLRLAGNDPNAIAKARDMMDRQLQHLVRLVDDLLDISRVTTGKVRLRKSTISLRPAVEAGVEASRPAIDAGEHLLSVFYSDQPIAIDADSTRITQVVGNLLTNAAKYTPKGGKIDLSVERSGEMAVIRVKDTGVGISTEMRERVFDMFAQVGNSIERSQGGLGIGLALVKRLVELHGGTVEAHSQGENRGSEFVVQLPIIPEKFDNAGRSIQHTADGIESDDFSTITERKRGCRVLVVDDNTDSAQSLAMLLDLEGHTAEVAETGLQALEIALSFKPELIFLDLGLPEMSGYEVARILLSDQRYGRPVLVALTGWGSEEHRRLSKDAGFDYHMTKPVGEEQIEMVLAQIRSS